MKIYCDTSTLPHNIRHADEKSQSERAALKRLAEENLMFGSGVVLRELMNTTEQAQRNNLIVDYRALTPIPKDEKVHGFHTQTDQYGGCITNPLISDVQDETIRDDLITGLGLEPRDAEHITQAVCNDCDVFLTRDVKTIIKHRASLETRFPALKFRLPSELLEELAPYPKP